MEWPTGHRRGVMLGRASLIRPIPPGLAQHQVGMRGAWEQRCGLGAPVNLNRIPVDAQSTISCMPSLDPLCLEYNSLRNGGPADV